MATPEQKGDKHGKTEHAPGWYDFAGGKRFWDGEEWTDHFAYIPPQPKTLDFWEIVGAVALGVILGFAGLWLGAQMAPDEIYLPVKFVVDPSELDVTF